MSGWGTKHDIVYEKPPNATVRAYAARSAAFYRSLARAFRRRRSRTSPTATPATTRAARTTRTRGSSPPTSPATSCTRRRSSARRHPDGGLADPARQHRDAGREQHLGPLPGQSRPVAPRPRLRAHLRAYVAAGFVGFLFGRGADGATCACDAAKDGITNPAPIDGNTTSVALRRRRRRLLPRAGARLLPSGPLPLPPH